MMAAATHMTILYFYFSVSGHWSWFGLVCVGYGCDCSVVLRVCLSGLRGHQVSSRHACIGNLAAISLLNYLYIIR